MVISAPCDVDVVFPFRVCTPKTSPSLSTVWTPFFPPLLRCERHHPYLRRERCSFIHPLFPFSITILFSILYLFLTIWAAFKVSPDLSSQPHIRLFLIVFLLVLQALNHHNPSFLWDGPGCSKSSRLNLKGSPQAHYFFFYSSLSLVCFSISSRIPGVNAMLRFFPNCAEHAIVPCFRLGTPTFCNIPAILKQIFLRNKLWILRQISLERRRWLNHSYRVLASQ